MKNIALRCENLKLAYEEKVIIEDLSVTIEKHKVTSIIGPNGCGKSTLLKGMGRILTPKAGEVYLEREPLSSYTTKDIARKVAILPQSAIAPPGIIVEDLVKYGRYPHQNHFGSFSVEDREIVDEVLALTKLNDIRTNEVDALSGGQRQRVWIAMALAQQSEIILLDEPTTYLDLGHQLDVLNLLEEMNRVKKTTIIMVLHDLNLASRFSDHLIAMKQGKIICQGSPEDVITHETLAALFSISANIIWEDSINKPIYTTYNSIPELC